VHTTVWVSAYTEHRDIASTWPSCGWNWNHPHYVTGHSTISEYNSSISHTMYTHMHNTETESWGWSRHTNYGTHWSMYSTVQMAVLSNLNTFMNAMRAPSINTSCCHHWCPVSSAGHLPRYSLWQGLWAVYCHVIASALLLQHDNHIYTVGSWVVSILVVGHISDLRST